MVLRKVRGRKFLRRLFKKNIDIESWLIYIEYVVIVHSYSITQT